ncbi:ribonuclease H-like domain-containing protein [Tanacetum coccineum]
MLEEFLLSEVLNPGNLNVVIRSNGQKRYFSTLMTVLSIFDREDLNAVYQLVMEKYQDEMPKGFDRVLWGDLIVLFNPDDKDEFWSSQLDWVIMLKLKLESEEENTMALELIKFVKKILAELESEEHKNWLVHKQTAYGKDFSNPFMVDNLPKIVRFSTHLASVVKSWLVHDQTVHALASPKANELTIPEQTATGKGTSNPLMAGCRDLFIRDSQGYHAVPPPYTGNFMPPKPNLVLADEEEYVFSESITNVPAFATSEVKTIESKPKSVSEPLIEDWIFDSKDENETEFKESVKKVENNKQVKYPRKNSQSPRGNKRNWNNLMIQKLGSNFEFKNKACYECGSFNHLIKDCDFYEKKMVWNNARRVNHQNSQRMTHPHPKGKFVPKAVLLKSGIKTLNTAGQNFSKAAVSVNTTRPINTAYPRPTVNSARTTLNVFNRSHVRRPFNKSTTNNNSNLNEKVNTVKGNVTTAGPKAVGNPHLELQEKGVIDSICSRHMTGNKSYLSDYEEINGGFIAFRGDPIGGKITGKGKISTGKLDFEDVYFVKELKFNLFSVSQMCDKKNNVLFTDTECVILSLDFKLLDENHVLFRVSRKDNMYSVV